VQDERLARGHSSGAWLIAPDGDWTLCMNITPTSIECQLGNACLSAKGDVEYHAIDAPTPQALLAAIEKCWHQYRKNWPRRKSIWRWRFMGRLMRERGITDHAAGPWKQPVEIKYLLEEKLNVRVMVDNDCVMLALAEKWQNEGQYRTSA
jgi:predicted NBD/HSP70 family sugar kinase